MMLSLYRTATFVGAPLIQIYLQKRLAEGKEDQARFAERKGKASLPRPDGRLIWLHAASVGESLSMLPLVEALLSGTDDLSLVLTTGSVTSAEIMLERLPDRAFHQFVPVDRANYVRRFLDHWRPDMALWAESEFWPNLILETQLRKIPMILVNGRISPRSFAGWQRARMVISRLLRDFTLCLGQTEEDADRLRQLGARRTACLGNLKFAVPPLPADTEELIRLEQSMSRRPRWLAASTHDGEETVAAQVHRDLSDNHPGLLTILVPRHAGRGGEVKAALENAGLRVASRSKGEPIEDRTDIYLADTMGELGLFYRLTDIVFMGKSLVPLGGQNPLEALRLDCAVVHGPHMMNFKEIAEEMNAAGCALQVEDGTGLALAIGRLLADNEETKKMAANGQSYVDSKEQVVHHVTEEILAILNNERTDRRDAAA
jgi:3-deoxy-D-manno-octulosonic-acid transferase